MKDIVILEDGKFFRGSKAKLIKRKNKRVLIEFLKYDSNLDEDVLVTEWFKLFIPSYVTNKKKFKHNNKRKSASFYHPETNEFYSDSCQTEEFKQKIKDESEEYFYQLYS